MYGQTEATSRMSYLNAAFLEAKAGSIGQPVKNGKFTLRRGFEIKKGAKVLIIEDVITTGKSSLECVKLIHKANAKLLGFASIIDRSTKKSLKIKTGIISHLKINVPTFSKNKLPANLKSIPISRPGSRFIK